MKISLVAVCFNSDKTISDTLHSVCQQTCIEIEHVIVDGGTFSCFGARVFLRS